LFQENFISTQYFHKLDTQTERQTDRQTDGQKCLINILRRTDTQKSVRPIISCFEVVCCKFIMLCNLYSL